MTAGLGISLKYAADWRQEIHAMWEFGFRGVELAADRMGVIAAGRLNVSRVNAVVTLLQDLPYWYTMHAPAALDLRNVEERAWQRDLLHATIRLAGSVGAGRLVVHFEGRSEVPAIERQMLELLSEAADLAQQEGVLLCIENIEIERVEPVIACIRELNHPSVMMTFDVGHAWLAAEHFGFDFFASLRSAAPYIAHLHVSDNFGRFETMRMTDFDRYRSISFKNLLMLGKGDLHLPVGYGSIPYHEVFRELRGYDGTVVMECRLSEYASELGPIFTLLQDRARVMRTSEVDSRATRNP